MEPLKKLLWGEQGSVPVILPATALIVMVAVPIIISIVYKHF